MSVNVYLWKAVQNMCCCKLEAVFLKVCIIMGPVCVSAYYQPVLLEGLTYCPFSCREKTMSFA